VNGSYRDIIVIGGSIGALEALKALLRDLPEVLPAAVLIVAAGALPKASASP
jgi:chemotaxis response regulator CheB